MPAPLDGIVVVTQPRSRATPSGASSQSEIAVTQPQSGTVSTEGTVQTYGP